MTRRVRPSSVPRLAANHFFGSKVLILFWTPLSVCCSVRRWQMTQENSRERRRMKEESLQADMAKWQANQDTRRAREQAALRFELSQAERMRYKQWAQREEAAMEAAGGMNEFERNAQRLGLPVPALAAASGGVAADDDDDDAGGGGGLSLTATEQRQLAATAHLDGMQHLRHLAGQLPDPKTQARNATLHMAAIRAKAGADAQARAEREKRRRAVLVEQAEAAEEAEEKRKQQSLLDMLARQSAAERQLVRAQHHKCRGSVLFVTVSMNA